MKACNKCGDVKALAEFAKSVSRRDGLQLSCRACCAAWAKSNRESKRKSRNAYYWRNRDSEIAKARAWQEQNVEKRRASNSRYHSKNSRAIFARKRSVKLRAMPAWANRFFIQEAARLAALRTKVTGIPHELDHIVPLKSPLVCGLHVENNLRVIPREENIRKSNRYWPDMPEGQ